MLGRRSFVRIPEELPVSYEILPDTKPESSFTKNISQGGICFFTNKLIPRGSRLKIKVTIQNIPFYFEAIVRMVWINKIAVSDRYEVGAEFINISEEAINRLVAYITNILKGE